MNLNPVLNAIAKCSYRIGIRSERDIVYEVFMSNEGSLEIRFPNDVIEVFYLPVDSKIKDFVENQENFKADITEDFVYPDVYVHETLFDLPPEIKNNRYLMTFCRSLKHSAVKPYDSRPLAFQNKVSDKKAKPMFSIREESGDAHFTKDTFDGVLRTNLTASFKTLEPDEILNRSNGSGDFMDYLQSVLPHKLYGLYTQESWLNTNLKYVSRRFWNYGRNERRIFNQESAEQSGVYVRETSPDSYKSIDYSKGLIFAYKFYRQFNYFSANRQNFSRGQSGKLFPILGMRDYPLNIGLSILNFPQMSADGKVVEKNTDNIYKSLRKINTASIKTSSPEGTAMESDYSRINYKQAADFTLPMELRPMIKSIVTYRWAKFYLAVNKYKENNGIS